MNSFKQTLDIRISYLLRSTYQNEDGKNPIVLRITYRGQRRDIFTGLYSSKSSWSNLENRVAGNNREAQQINQHLERIQYNVREHFDKLRFSGNVFTIDELVTRVRGEEEPPQAYCDINSLASFSNTCGSKKETVIILP